MNTFSFSPARRAWLLLILVLALAAARPAAAQVIPPTGAAPGAPGGDAANSTKAIDLDSTIPMTLNGVDINQIMKFISENTGKPVIKKNDVNTQVTIIAPKPVTRRKALEMLYDFLKMNDIYVVEQDGMIQLVTAASLKNVPMTILDDDVDVQKMPDSTEVVQKIYKLKNISADDINKHLQKLLPADAITLDPKTNTVILTDQLVRIKQFDRIVKALDSRGGSDLVTETFKLVHASAQDLANTLGNIISKTSMGGGTLPSTDQGPPRRGSGSGTQPGIPVQSGNITLIPDTRLNWIIVVCPKDQLDKIRDWITQFDNDKQDDLKPRTIELKHAEADSVSTAISQLFRDRFDSGKDTVRTSVTDDGTRIIVYSSEANFKQISTLVEELDTSSTEKRESRTYPIKNLEAQSLADQLTKLMTGGSSNGNNGGSNYQITYVYDYSGTRRPAAQAPSFVPSPRSNSLLVMARPKDFEFIEKMIKELDVPIDDSAFEPRIYHIQHTDASTLVNVLETLFQGKSDSRNAQDPYSYIYRPQTDTTTDAIQSVFGKVRFVVDSVTNTIVALSSNVNNYKLLDSMIHRLDQADPEDSEVMVIKLKYADPVKVANQINNLLSEGAVNRPNQPGPNNGNNNNGGQNANGNNGNNNTSAMSSTPQLTAENEETFTPTWQSGQQNQQRQTNTTPERPVNTMIGNVRIVPDKRANTLMVASPRVYFDTIKLLIESLDQQEPQVHIQTRILTVSHGAERRIGVRWTPDPSTIDPAELDNALLGLNQIGFLGSAGGGHPITNTIGSALGGVTNSYTSSPGSGNTVLASNINVGLLVQLLLKNSESRIILDPNLTVHNNETGTLFSGSEFAFQNSLQQSNVGGPISSSIYRPVGIELDVRPHINNKGEVVLRVLVNNSKVHPGELVNGQIVTDRTTIQTEVAVSSGQTLVIAGINENDQEKTVRKVPILGSIPIVNWFFSKTDKTDTVNELVFFLTPSVLKDSDEADELLDETRQKLQGIGESNPLQGIERGKGDAAGNAVRKD